MGSQKKGEVADGRITEEAMAEYRSRVGIKLAIRWVYQGTVTKVSITDICRGVGDVNPLYMDEDYAQRARYGKMVAPPYWFYANFITYVQHGLPGVHAWHSGGEWEFYKPAFLGDKITPECVFPGFEEKTGRMASRLIFEYQDSTYHNQKGQLLSKVHVWLIRAERADTRETGKYSHLQVPHPWTDEELEKLDEEILAEQIRGSEVRYWEDVQVGEELPQLVKGPQGLEDQIAWQVATNGISFKAYGAALRAYKEHPTWAFRDPENYSWHSIAGVHWSKYAANRAGLPYIYDTGVHMNAVFLQLFTNWMGDEGWLKRAYCEYRGFFYFGDVMWLRGKVTKKYIDEKGEACVDIEAWTLNQRRENIMPGNATVVLPSRDRGTWPLKVRLSK